MELISWEVKCDCGNTIKVRGLTSLQEEFQCKDCGKGFQIIFKY